MCTQDPLNLFRLAQVIMGQVMAKLAGTQADGLGFWRSDEFIQHSSCQLIQLDGQIQVE